MRSGVHDTQSSDFPWDFPVPYPFPRPRVFFSFVCSFVPLFLGHILLLYEVAQRTRAARVGPSNMCSDASLYTETQCPRLRDCALKQHN